MENKLITVLMSIYNVKEDEIKLSIESILNQTYTNFEFIIIDDGVSENIIDIINSYDDKRIKIYKNNINIGLAQSLNKGIKLAKGEYIVRMDADDISHLDRISKQISFIEKHHQYAIVASKADIFDENGVYANTKISGEINKEDLAKGTPFVHPTMIINRKILNEIGGYPDYRRGQDYAMVMNLYSYGYKGYIIDEVLIDYRMDKDGYKKKKFKYRILEAKIRLKYFRKMKIRWYNYIYIIKPIIVGMMPKTILKKYHEIKLKNRGK